MTNNLENESLLNLIKLLENSTDLHDKKLCKSLTELLELATNDKLKKIVLTAIVDSIEVYKSILKQLKPPTVHYNYISFHHKSNDLSNVMFTYVKDLEYYAVMGEYYAILGE